MLSKHAYGARRFDISALMNSCIYASGKQNSKGGRGKGGPLGGLGGGMAVVKALIDMVLQSQVLFVLLFCFVRIA